MVLLASHISSRPGSLCHSERLSGVCLCPSEGQRCLYDGVVLSQAVCFLLVVGLSLNFIPLFGGGTPARFLSASLGDAVLCTVNALGPSRPECAVAGYNLAACVFSMLLSQLFQTMLVKYASYAISVVMMR